MHLEEIFGLAKWLAMLKAQDRTILYHICLFYHTILGQPDKRYFVWKDVRRSAEHEAFCELFLKKLNAILCGKMYAVVRSTRLFVSFFLKS
jgi:hypothetical protein